MLRGGKRAGAGRKKGSTNLLTQELRSCIHAPKLIHFLQNVALGEIDGSTMSERIEAAVVLLKKILPDCKMANESEATTESCQFIVVKKYDAKTLI